MIKAHVSSEAEAACTGSAQVWVLSKYCASGLLFLWASECVNEWSLCAFSLAPLLLSVLSNSNVLVFILPYYIFLLSLEACLFSNDTAGRGGTGRSKGWENYNQDILCEGETYF